MKNKDIITLKNGQKIIFLKNKKFHRKQAYIVVRYGGDNNEFLINNKKYHMHDGMAHFLEHLLIEQSKFGNMLINFNNDSIITNGFTSNQTTTYYINTVHDFEENLVKLIKFVNIPNFNKKNIELIKPAIIEEIRRTKDNEFRHLFFQENMNLFNKKYYRDILGTEKEIKNITYEEVKKCYDVFYQFDNQYIFIEGNVNKGKIIKLIRKTYNDINKEKIDCQILKPTLTDKIMNKQIEVFDNVHMQYVEMCFKINIKDFNPYEKVKFTFYMNYYLIYKFGGASIAYKELVNKKISNTSINYDCDYSKDYIIVRVGTRTEKEKQFIELILKQLSDKKITKQHFDLMKKLSIMKLINREENNCELNSFISNVIEFNYYKKDKIEDIEKQNYKEFTQIFSKLNFDNYCIALLKDRSKK